MHYYKVDGGLIKMFYYYELVGGEPDEVVLDSTKDSNLPSDDLSAIRELLEAQEQREQERLAPLKQTTGCIIKYLAYGNIKKAKIIKIKIKNFIVLPHYLILLVELLMT